MLLWLLHLIFIRYTSLSIPSRLHQAGFITFFNMEVVLQLWE